MTESSQVWQHTRKYLSPFGKVRRVEHKLEGGWPDCVYTIRGVTGWIELKMIPNSERCPDHFTLDQLLFGEEEVAAGGRWHLLARRGKEWLLLNVGQARAWFDGKPLEAQIRAEGKFPLREILKELLR